MTLTLTKKKKQRNNARKWVLATPLRLSPVNRGSTGSRCTLIIHSENPVTSPTRRHVTVYTFSYILQYFLQYFLEICNDTP